MERETGIEPATSSLGSWHSTAELLPLDDNSSKFKNFLSTITEGMRICFSCLVAPAQWGRACGLTLYSKVGSWPVDFRPGHRRHGKCRSKQFKSRIGPSLSSGETSPAHTQEASRERVPRGLWYF